MDIVRFEVQVGFPSFRKYNFGNPPSCRENLDHMTLLSNYNIPPARECLEDAYGRCTAFCCMRGFVCHLHQLCDVRLYMEIPEISGILFEGWPNIQSQPDPTSLQPCKCLNDVPLMEHNVALVLKRTNS